MTDLEWDKIKYFNKSERWGDPSKMSFDLLRALDHLRELADTPITIHCGYSNGEGHSDNSYHYRGLAVDLHIGKMHVVDQFLLASRIPAFTGIGMYPFWNNPGLHLDVRPVGTRAMWGRNAAGVYVSLDVKFLRSVS